MGFKSFVCTLFLWYFLRPKQVCNSEVVRIISVTSVIILLSWTFTTEAYSLIQNYGLGILTETLPSLAIGDNVTQGRSLPQQQQSPPLMAEEDEDDGKHSLADHPVQNSHASRDNTISGDETMCLLPEGCS